MSVAYNKIRTRTGGPAIGTIMQVARPGNWNSGTDDWNIDTLYPGWVECDGRSLNGSDGKWSELYRIIGNTYGGSGNIFKLPDYRGVKLMGTGKVDGNNGSSPSLSPQYGPTGTEGTGGPLDPGSVGGDYLANVTRFAPSDSEVSIDPVSNQGSPVGERVWYYASEFNNFGSVSTSNSRITGFGDGTREVNGFAKPLFAEIVPNDQYYSLTSTNNLTSGTVRTLTISNVNLTNYDKIFFTVIAGNDVNGGERPNSPGVPGDDLVVRFTRGANSQDVILIPAKGNTGLEFDDWDIKYATWNTITVDIPGFMKGSGGSIQFRAATFFAGAIGDGGEFNDSYYTG
jgi:hypothetical protein